MPRKARAGKASGDKASGDEARPDEDPGGAMTGATGSLTPESGEAFVPAELREIADPAHHRDVTAAQRRESAARHAGIGEPGREEPSGGPHDDAPRDAGYGSEHGLRPDDPAYRHEEHPSASEAERLAGGQSRPAPRPAGDGDERSDQPDRF